MSHDLDHAFRKAMRSLTSAVTVLSAVHEGRWFGMVATAVTSLCMEPPSLLACVNTSSSIHAPLLARAKFCVNILHASQSDVARAFGTRPSKERFLAGEWATSLDCPPYLMGAQANILCDLGPTFVHGTHRIVIGHVSKVITREDISPLLYENGHYTTSLPAGPLTAQNN